MNHLHNEAVQKLLANSDQPAVTLYMPTVTNASPPHITENQIRFKNLIHQAVTLLDERPDSEALGKELTELQATLHDDPTFWEQHNPGLLLCATPGHSQFFALPIETEEYVAVDESFHLAPVLGLLGDDKEFYVLSLAQQAPKLFRGDMYGLTATAIRLPRDAFRALGLDETRKKSDSHGSASGSSMNGGFNGRGGAHNPQDEDRARFFRLIDNVVTDKLDPTAPLILAGVESDVAEYRQLSKVPHILQASISGNHKDDAPEQLFKQAYVIARQELIMPEHRAAIEEYQRLHGANPERVASDHASLERAAMQGRIDKLLTRLTRQTTDNVQDGYEAVQRITFPEREQSRLLNKLAAAVYDMSGKVISLLPSEMPEGALMVARLRY